MLSPPCRRPPSADSGANKFIPYLLVVVHKADFTFSGFKFITWPAIPADIINTVGLVVVPLSRDFKSECIAVERKHLNKLDQTFAGFSPKCCRMVQRGARPCYFRIAP